MTFRRKQESAERVVERVRLLEVGEVAAVELDETGSRDRATHGTNFGERDDRILVAGDHERRHVDADPSTSLLSRRAAMAR